MELVGFLRRAYISANAVAARAGRGQAIAYKRQVKRRRDAINRVPRGGVGSHVAPPPRPWDAINLVPTPLNLTLVGRGKLGPLWLPVGGGIIERVYKHITTS